MKNGKAGIALKVIIVLGALLLATGIAITVAQRGARNPAGILFIIFGISLIYIGRRTRRITCCSSGQAAGEKPAEKEEE